MCSTPNSGWSETYRPSISRSKFSLVFLSHSESGIATSNAASASSSPPNSESWPIASFRLRSMTESTACSWISTRPLRGCANESNAPALTRLSMTRLLQTRAGTLRRKSAKLVNSPLDLRAAMIASTTLIPTLRIAARPNRTSAPTAVNVATEAFTSGGSTFTPIRRHSLR